MTLDGNKQNQYNDDLSKYGRHGILTIGNTNVLLDRIRTKNFQGHGFDNNGNEHLDVGSQNLIINQCLAENNNYDGFMVRQSKHVVILSSGATGNGRHGFHIVNGTTDVIMDNNFAGNNGYSNAYNGCGFTIQNYPGSVTRDLVIINNYSERNKDSGYCLFYVQNVTLDNNLITDSSYCFTLHNVSGSVIIDNHCETDELLKMIGTNLTDVYDNSTGVYFYNNSFNQTITNSTETTSTDTDDITTGSTVDSTTPETITSSASSSTTSVTSMTSSAKKLLLNVMCSIIVIICMFV